MKKILFLPIATLLLLAGCQKPENTDTKPDPKPDTPAQEDALKLDKTSITAEADGATATIQVTANCDWTVTNALDWVSVTPASGKSNGSISVTVSANAGAERSGKFSVKGGTLSPVEVSVSQAAAVSKLALGTPAFDGKLMTGSTGTAAVEIPYTGALGTDSVPFVVTVSGNGSAGIEKTEYTHNFTAGDGKVRIPISGTPTAFGSVAISVTADGTPLEPNLEARVGETPRYKNYVTWNFWGYGYTRADYGLVRGSAFDYSWTSEAVNKTESTNASDHVVLPSDGTIPGWENARMSAVGTTPAAGGTTTAPATVSSVAGYTFNPSIQIQGLKKDDYYLFTVPVTSLPAGTKVHVESALGGAAAAAGYFIMEYSLDGNTWTEAPDAKSIEVGGDTYKYHFEDTHSTDKTIRYTYSRDTAVDAGFATYTMALPAALSNATIYIRLRAVGLNGNSAVMTKTGWSEVKFFEVSFD
jgi:hypothetical protein